tara:strand:+ start:1627 stop:2490 length:864 start_codon:yes stop_codon:yes gene_type:complete
MTETPQLSTPEGQEGLASPAQQELVQELQQQDQISEETQQVLQKFNSTEDLAKSYAELQRKFTQNQQQKSEPQTEPQTETPQPTESYSRDQAVSIYGEAGVEALASKGLKMEELMHSADNGGDISEHYDTLAETFNVPTSLVEGFVNTYGKSGQAADTSNELTAADEEKIIGEVGGPEAYKQMGEWANKNMSDEMVKEFNKTMDGGNIDSIRWAIRSMQLEMANPRSVVEPKLIGGGDVPSETVFRSQQQVLDAMNKRNDRGQKLYEVDEAYQQNVKEILARSPDLF